MSKRRKYILCIITIVFAVMTAWIIWDNSVLEVNTVTVSSAKLPDAFSGFRIAQVSDLHNTQIGSDNSKLLSMLRETEPDMIAITGDLIDSRNTDLAVALAFAAEAVKIAPCYYVTGNHESRIPEYESLKEGLSELGVTVLEDEAIELVLQQQAITLIGVDDPSFQTDYLFGDAEGVMDETLQAFRGYSDTFTLLLSHRPELFQVYCQNEIDLVLSGHAHGGQFRLPLIGGLYAPNQGLFPQYYEGLYTQNSTQMIVSRGIGNSLFPFRFNNRPEIILIELQSS